ncbi:MAG: hypothetical protein HQK93_03870 [Nitrospirae bacterium]|nr:hypothetical protein [Nitrospirota bacterium]
MKLDDLTVFVVSCAEDTMDECMDALMKQDCEFNIEHIKDVYPMSKAFQDMPDRCKTPYFIQVDADMILEPTAIRQLYETAKKTGFFKVVIYGQLFEEGFGVGGTVRLWKRHLFRFFSFNDCRTVDRNLFKRIKRFGFRLYSIDKVLGVHKPRHSDFSTYLKAKSDVEKWKFLKRPVEQYAIKLYDEIIDDISNRSVQFFGLLTGALTPKHRYIRSKDLSIEKDRFENITKMLGIENILPEIKINMVDNSVRELFSQCYMDFNSSDIEKRRHLVKYIIKIFKNADIKECNPEDMMRFLDM